MVKDWFHIPSLDTTINLNVVSEICWNKRSDFDKAFRTVIYLGTSLTVDQNYGTCYNEMSIFAEADRKALHAKFPGIPILLLFAEVIPEPESVVEPEELM